jgi:hypothetical protein
MALDHVQNVRKSRETVPLMSSPTPPTLGNDWLLLKKQVFVPLYLFFLFLQIFLTDVVKCCLHRLFQ